MLIFLSAYIVQGIPNIQMSGTLFLLLAIVVGLVDRLSML